jgi:hypothetical protein
MLNHNTEKGGERVAHYFYDADAQIFKVISKTSYEPGQQVRSFLALPRTHAHHCA